MTRTELIDALAVRFPQLTHKDVDCAVREIFSALSDTLAAGSRIEIRGFGSMDVIRRDARIGRNPKTGELVSVPTKYTPTFRVGKELRERVNVIPGAIERKRG